MQPATAVPGTPAVAHPLQPQTVAPASGNGAGPLQPLLYHACRDGDATTVKRLLAADGISINAIDPDTRLTPLMLAAWHGHDDVVFVLTRAGQSADVHLQNSRGDSALSLAAGAGKDEVIELLLLKKAQPDQANHSGRTPLAEAAAGGHLKTAALLIANGAQVNAGAGTGEPALIVAAQRGDSALVELLLDKKASTDVTDRYGWTAFNHAAGNGRQTLAGRLRGDNAAKPAVSLPSMPSAPTEQQCEAIVAGTTAPANAKTTAQEAPTNTTTAKTPATPTVTTVVTTQPTYVVRAAPGTPAGSASTGLTSLRKAVERNDLEALNQIITAHPADRAMLNQTTAFERQRGLLPAGSCTLLMPAAAHGHRPMVEALPRWVRMSMPGAAARKPR